jgi:SAM-dependent methyltransferase
MRFARPCLASLAAVALLWASAVAAPPAPTAFARETPPPPKVGQPGKDVVWVPTDESLVEEMLTAANVTPQDRVVDLGSGDGRTVIAAAKRGADARGIEFNPDMVALSKRTAEREGVAERAHFIQGDIFETDFSDATVVTLFLLSDLNIKLRPRLLEMAPGTRVVSNTFDMGDWVPDQTLDGGTSCQRYCRGYLWIVPAKVAGTWTLPEGELTLTQTYQMIGGTLRANGRDVPITDGKVKGQEISFTAGDRTVTARLNGESLDGRIRSAQGEAPWRATRRSSS